MALTNYVKHVALIRMFLNCPILHSSESLIGQTIVGSLLSHTTPIFYKSKRKNLFFCVV